MLGTKRRSIIVAAILLLVVGAGGAWWWEQSRRYYANRLPDVAEKFGGDEGLDVIKNPTKVEAFRITPRSADIDWRDAVPDDHPVTAGPVPLSAADVEKVSAALVSPRSYYWGDKKKACKPVYGVKLSFFRGEDRIDVMLCFACRMLWLARNGVTTGGGNFDAIQPVLARAVKAAFPDDPLIQAIKEGRSGPSGL